MTVKIDGVEPNIFPDVHDLDARDAGRHVEAAACLQRKNLRARAFKAATSRRSLANSKHDLTFRARTEGFQQEQRGRTP